MNEEGDDSRPEVSAEVREVLREMRKVAKRDRKQKAKQRARREERKKQAKAKAKARGGKKSTGSSRKEDEPCRPNPLPQPAPSASPSYASLLGDKLGEIPQVRRNPKRAEEANLGGSPSFPQDEEGHAMPDQVTYREGGPGRGLIAVVAILSVLLVGVLLYTHPWSRQEGLTEAEVSDMISDFAVQMPAPVAEIPDDVVRKSDLASLKTTIDAKAFDQTYQDTLWATVKDPVTGKIDSTMVVKTRTRNPLTDLQKELESTKAEARAAKVAARSAEKRLKETPTQFAVTVPSTSVATSLHQPGGVQLGGTSGSAVAPAPTTTRTSTQPGLVSSAIGGGSPPPPATSLASSASAAPALVGGEICYTDGTYTYISKQVLVGMNEDGTERAATPSDGKYYVVGGNMFPWAPTEARQILEDRGDWLAFKAVPPAGIQVVWKDPRDARSEGGLVWSPVHRFDGLPGVDINRATGEYKYKPVRH